MLVLSSAMARDRNGVHFKCGNQKPYSPPLKITREYDPLNALEMWDDPLDHNVLDPGVNLVSPGLQTSREDGRYLNLVPAHIPFQSDMCFLYIFTPLMFSWRMSIIPFGRDVFGPKEGSWMTVDGPLEVSRMTQTILRLFGRPEFLAILLPFSTFVGVQSGNGCKPPSTSPWYSWCPPFAGICLPSPSNGHCPPFSLNMPSARICQNFLMCPGQRGPFALTPLSNQHPTNSIQGARFARRPLF